MEQNTHLEKAQVPTAVPLFNDKKRIKGTFTYVPLFHLRKVIQLYLQQNLIFFWLQNCIYFV